jgi:hypothetical protein
MIVRADDPWWDVHYPPNGWGCSCYVRALSQGDIDRHGLKGKIVDPSDKKDPNAKKLLEAKVHKDWQHAPGMQAFHNPTEAMLKGVPTPKTPKTQELEWTRLDEFMGASKQKERLPDLEEITKNRGQAIDTDGSNIHDKDSAKQRQNVIDFIKRKVIKDKDKDGNYKGSKTFDLVCGKFRDKIVVDAEILGHIAENVYRLGYLGYLKDMLNPQEVWVDYIISTIAKVKPFARPHRGKTALRYTAVTSINDPTGKYKGLAMVYQSNGKGEMVLYTFYPLRNSRDITKLRTGYRIGLG